MKNKFEQTKAAFRLTVLGARGSMPIEGENYSLYGGATSCYKVEAGNEEIYLDAGSGIVNAIPAQNSRITVLLTHVHLDHIIGFPFFIACLCARQRRTFAGRNDRQTNFAAFLAAQARRISRECYLSRLARKSIFHRRSCYRYD